MKSNSRRNVLFGAFSGALALLTAKVAGGPLMGPGLNLAGLTKDEMLDLYLEKNGFWRSLDVAIERESRKLSFESTAVFKQAAAEQLRREYRQLFARHLSSEDIVELLKISDNKAMASFHEANLQINRGAHRVMHDTFQQVRQLAAEAGQKKQA